MADVPDRGHAYIGKGKRVHALRGDLSQIRYGYTHCRIGGSMASTTLPVDCKSCIRELARKETY